MLNHYRGFFLLASIMLAFFMFVGCGSSASGDSSCDQSYRDSVDTPGFCVTPDWQVIRTYVVDKAGPKLILYRVNPTNNMRYNALFVVEFRRNGHERIAIASANISPDNHYLPYPIWYAGYFQIGEWVDIRVRANSTCGMKEKSVVIRYEDQGREMLTVMEITGDFWQSEGLTE